MAKNKILLLGLTFLSLGGCTLRLGNTTERTKKEVTSVLSNSSPNFPECPCFLDLGIYGCYQVSCDTLQNNE